MTTPTPPLAVLRKRLLGAAFVLGISAVGIAQAQSAAPAPGRHASAATVEERQARFAEHVAKRQQALHDALKLTSAQEAAWTSFVNATRPQPRDASVRPDRAAWASLPAPQRLEQRIARQKERTTRMEAHLAAVNSFYAVLTPEQKKVFDTSFHQGFGGRHGRHHGGHHGPQGA
ncbi:MAG: Spy/CpxP family protein refolding chaperone [Gammaproteobacteria bacterium]